MNNQQFIDKIVDLYRKAKNISEDFAVPGVIARGRNHSISSIAEDLLANFIARRCNLTGFELMVDYPISFKSKTKKTDTGQSATKTIYPGISIVKKVGDKRSVVAMIDLKMDLGWKRNFNEYLETLLPMLDEPRTVGIGQYKELDENGDKVKKHTSIRISRALKWHIPIISNQNIGEDKMAINLRAAREKSYRNKVFMYIFSREHHPNSPFAPKVDGAVMDDFIAKISAALK